MKLPQTALRQVEHRLARHGLAATEHSPLLRLRATRPSCIRQAAPRLKPWTARTYSTVSAADLQFGQPVHETHPHILAPGELTPGISAQEYANRRASLTSLLPDSSIAILPSSTLQYKSGAVFYPFRQESNFLYLTGFAEPESLAVIRKTSSSPGLDNHEFTLLCRPKDPAAEQWSGPWSGTEAAMDVFNADVSDSIHKMESLLPELVKGVRYIYTDTSNTTFTALLRQANPSASILSLKQAANTLRSLKSPAEIAVMRQAGRATGRAFTNAMRQPWDRESQLAAFLDYEFIRNGGDGQAYVPVVAGGSRGNMIHYTLNNASIQPDQMVLVDAGAEYGGYIADVTRTWPVSGKFTGPQKDLYEAVLKVQRTGVALCRASANLTLDEIHRITERELKEQLALLGFDVSGDAMGILFPHHVGHYVGLDVHDVPGYGRDVKLRAGHCVTVEPGVYVPDDERWPAHFRGLGVRIEDSVAVDEEGPTVLTVEAVKEVVDIEALRG